jgi:hypothetical protein
MDLTDGHQVQSDLAALATPAAVRVTQISPVPTIELSTPSVDYRFEHCSDGRWRLTRLEDDGGEPEQVTGSGCDLFGLVVLFPQLLGKLDAALTEAASQDLGWKMDPDYSHDDTD